MEAQGIEEASKPATNDPYAEATAFTDGELKQLTNRLGLQFNLTDLENLENFDMLYGYVHTGPEPNEFNSGITNHWLAIYGKYVLDSYGKYSAWDLPSWVVPVQTIPRALQAYDSNVCGIYAAAYLKHCDNLKNLKTNPGRSFSVAFDFTKDRKQNDNIILDWYHGL